jgi:hypothetical protein
MGEWGSGSVQGYSLLDLLCKFSLVQLQESLSCRGPLLHPMLLLFQRALKRTTWNLALRRGQLEGEHVLRPGLARRQTGDGGVSRPGAARGPHVDDVDDDVDDDVSSQEAARGPKCQRVVGGTEERLLSETGQSRPQQPMPPPPTPLIAQLPLQGARKVTHQHVRFALRFSLLLKPCFDIALRLFFSRTQAQHRSTVFHTGIAHASLPSTHRQKIYQGRSGADFSD